MVPVMSSQTQAMHRMTVTAAHGSAGDLVSITDETERVKIANLFSSQGAIEYRVGTGAWQMVMPGMATDEFLLDLSADTIRIRRAFNVPLGINVEIFYWGIPAGLYTGKNNLVEIPSAVSGAGVSAPSTLDSGSATYNGATLHLAAAGTLTVGTGWLAVLPSGVAIIVGQSGSATLAFSGAATKENSSGTSASSVTLVAGGVYAWLPSPSGSDKGRLTGGAST